MIESWDETEEYNLGTWEGNPLPVFPAFLRVLKQRTWSFTDQDG